MGITYVIPILIEHICDRATIMKTAISIPDPIFQAGETLAKNLNLSRSELYTKALQTFIAAHDAQHITDALNEVYNEHSSSLEPGIASLQLASLPREDW